MFVAVAFARLLFPAEAKVAMDATGAELSSIFYASLGLSRSEGLSGNLREVNMNKTPSVQTERLQMRLQTLLETGMIYLIFFFIGNKIDLLSNY